MDSDASLKQLLVYLFAGSRGAEMRVRIILALADRPANTNQLARELEVDYKAIRYQLDVLSKNRLVQTPNKNGYGALYFLTPVMQGSLVDVREIWKRYGKTMIKQELLVRS